jgi:sec-independent protein translocase protein TatA
MFNIGPQELLLILVLALLVVGPKRLPELGRSLGRGIRELRKAQDEVRKTIQINLDDEPSSPTTSTSHATPRSIPVEEPSANGSAPANEPEPGDVAGPAVAAGAAASDAGPGISEISRTLGRSLAELRRARQEIQRTFRVDLDPPASTPAPPRTEPTTSAPAPPTDATTPTLETEARAADPGPTDGDTQRDPELPG